MRFTAGSGELLWTRDVEPCHFNCPPPYLNEDYLLVMTSDSVPAKMQALYAGE